MTRSENQLKPELSIASNNGLWGKKVLVIAPAWIGDMVMAQTLFKVIKHRFPSASIDVLAPKWTLALAERMPEIRRRILFPFGHGELRLYKRYQFAKRLRSEAYDEAIVLPGSMKSALTAWVADIPIRTGWLGEWRFGVLNDIRRLDRKVLPLMVQQFAALGLPKENPHIDLTPYYPSLEIDAKQRELLGEQWQFREDMPLIALCPGAEYGIAKRWPPAYFAEVAKQMLERGCQVAIFGSAKETSLAEEINKQVAFRCIDLTGKTTLLEAVDLLSLANGVIANDSGLMHIAAALNRPLVVLYGSSSPDFTPPLSNVVSVARLNLPCSPCFKRECPVGHFNCMNQLHPEFVLDKLTPMICQ